MKKQAEIEWPNVNLETFFTHNPSSSAGKESTCNAGDPSSIPESGRSSGDGIGYPLQCLAWRIPWSPRAHTESDTTEQLSLHFS